MTEEQIFKNHFPEYCVGEKCLSPYFDLFQTGFEEGENQNKELKELLKEAVQLLKNSDELYGYQIRDFQLKCEQFTKESE